MIGQLSLKFDDPAPSPPALTLADRQARAAHLIPPRDYQRAALDAVHAAYARGVTRQMVVMATGAGKTVVAGHLVNEIDLPAVMFVHRDELVQQSVAKLGQVNPDARIGVVQGPRNDVHAPVIVASVQTLAQPRRLAALVQALPRSPLVISDECHHDVSRTRRAAIDALAPALLVGVTATPGRGDGQGLGGIYEEIVYSLGMIDLMARGRLAPLRGLRIESDADLDAVRTVAGELVESDLATAVDVEARNDLCVRAWQRHAGDRRRTVAFCVTVAHARNLAAAFVTAGVRAAVIDGATPPEERRATLAAFKRGDIQVICNCAVLTEGYDEPGIDAILMARPTKSQPLYVQMVGRGARIAEGKADCLVIDVVDATRRHTLITLPTLAGDPAAKDAGAGGTVDARAPGQVIDLLEYAQQQQMAVEQRAVAVDLFSGAALVWRTVAGVHMAPVGDGSYAVLHPAAGGYVPFRVARPRPDLPAPPGAAVALERLYERPLDLGYAMGIAEDRLLPVAAGYARREASWRTRADTPSEAQTKLARRLGLTPAPGETKAQLSARIDDAMFAGLMRKVRFDTES